MKPTNAPKPAWPKGPALPQITVTLLFAFLAPLAMSAAAKSAGEDARVSTALSPDGGHIVVEAHGMPAPVPLFFTAEVNQTIRLGPTAIAGEIQLHLRVLQGMPELVTLGLAGDGDIVTVTGNGVRGWSVRQAGGHRFLDLKLTTPDGAHPIRDFNLQVRTRTPDTPVPGSAVLLLTTPGDAVGFTSRISLRPDPSVDVRVTSADGLFPINPAADAPTPLEFQTAGAGRLEVRMLPRGAALSGIELGEAQLTARNNEPAHALDFILRGQLRVTQSGARLRLLMGHAALSERAAGDGWHIELVPLDDADEFAYDLVGERAGTFLLELPIAAGLQENGDWQGVEFRLFAGAVVPLHIEGLGADVEFSPKAPVVPSAGGGGIWQGFLPADGTVSLAWKQTRATGEESLSFTSFEQDDVRLGAGLWRQTATINFRILQGKLPAVRIQLDGPGEVLGVEGANVTGWQVVTRRIGTRARGAPESAVCHRGRADGAQPGAAGFVPRAGRAAAPDARGRGAAFGLRAHRQQRRRAARGHGCGGPDAARSSAVSGPRGRGRCAPGVGLSFPIRPVRDIASWPVRFNRR